MDALHSTATTALGMLLSEQPNTREKIAFAWQIVAGPAMSRAAQVVWTGDGVLRVRARSESWRREIVRGEPMILDRLRQVLGRGVVRKLIVESRNAYA